MDINLTIYDMKMFLDKYTRFMTKDIYISNKMYTNFLNNYKYLYDILDKDRFLYSDNKLYKKIMDIKKNKDSLIRLHNQKYLNSALKRYDNFFDKVIVSEKLDNRKKMIVLSEEENTYIVGNKNYLSLLISKLKYLIDYKNYREDNILVLVNDGEEAKIINKYCNRNNINISIYTIKDYSNNLISDKYVVDDNKSYEILINYIMNNLFKDKTNFNSFYKAFSKYIYLNKDYKDYDTFKDYHNYMYKRKYLSSNLSLHMFNESEINKRKTYLRTINNEVLKNKQEVDIANFLCLNSIDYIYTNDTFKLLDKNICVKYINGKEDNKNTSKDDTIYLYKEYDNDNTYLKVLVYELIKRRYPLELISDNNLYNKLSSTNIDNYFSEFITKYLIPLINYYDNDKDLSKLNLSNLQEEFLKIYDMYNKYIVENNLITNKVLISRIEEEVLNSKYKYLFLVGDINLNINIPTFTIVSDYNKTELIKENIKLLYDYKNYLYNNQIIPIRHTYLNKQELNNLTNKFLKDNLDIINKNIKDNSKNIKIYEYDDNNRLHIYNNIESICFDIINEYNNILIGLKSIKDINILIGNNNFSKLDKNTIITKNNKKIRVEEILKIDKLYDTIILPYIIKDSYHDELNISDYYYNIKVFIYVALSKCKNNLILLCPKTKRKELDKILNNIKKEL